MARAVRSDILTPTAELRTLLDECERRTVSIRDAGTDATLELFSWLDRITELIPELEEQGVNLQSELGRWQAVRGMVLKYSSAIRRELKPLGGIEPSRNKLDVQPSNDRFWWWLDVIARDQRTKQMRRTSIIVASIAAAVVVGLFIFNRLFPVDPNVRESYRLVSEGEFIVSEGDEAGAISKFEEALGFTPNDIDLLAWLVVLYTRADQQDEAAQKQEALFEVRDEADAYIAIADKFVRVSDPESALDYIDIALEIAPESPTAYTTAATAYEMLGDFGGAISSLQTAADLAEEAGMIELVAIARIRMGQLLQGAQIQGPQTQTVEP